MKLNHLMAALALAGLATGCAEIQKHETAIRDDANRIQAQAKQAVANANAKFAAESVVSRVDGAWLGNRYVVAEIKKEGGLPPFLDTSVTVRDQSGQLSTVEAMAERVVTLTGIPVRIMPDVNLTSSTGATTPSAPAPMSPMMPMQGMPPGQGMPTVSTVDYSGKVSGFLDMICARFGLAWKYQDKQVYIYRFVTREFSLDALPGTTKFKASVSKAGGGSGGSSGSTSGGSSYNSTSNVDTDSELAVWRSMQEAVTQMLSKDGKVALNQSTGTLVVTDVKENVERVAKFVERENAILTRQVAVDVQVLTVTLDNSKEYGIDWNLVYSKLSNLAPDWTLGFTSPSTLLGTAAGSVGLQIVSPIDSNGLTDRMTGSQALFQALSSVGAVSVVTSTTAITLNRQPIPVAVTNQTGYLASTSPATAAAGGTGGVPGLVPGTVTTGFILNLLPAITDDNRVLLRFALDLSDLKRIGTISVGSGATLQSIQTPEILSTQFMQGVSLKGGETLVLTGFERASGQADRATLSEEAPIGLGGSYKGNRSRTMTVVMLTPKVLASNR